MKEQMLLCRTCDHWFDTDMSGEECPICWLRGVEGIPLPSEPENPNDWELDRFGHAIERKVEQ